jgi:hypothetical protein
VIANIKSMYDPTMIQDPRDVAERGLLVDENGNVIPADRLPSSPVPRDDNIPDEANIQRRESETRP